jgi:UDP-glucuronate decarboxylase
MSFHIEKKHTILIPGGAGFIGAHLVSKYLAEGHRVIVVDNLQTTWKPKNIAQYFSNPNFRFINQDIIEPLALDEKIDWIINCACSGSPTSYQFNPIHTTKTNTIGVINLLELARRHGATFLQTSTSEVYGDPAESPQRETYLGNVSTIGPRACYDEGKRVAETLVMDYHREFGVDVRIVRIFNTYGPLMDQNDGRALTNFVVNAIAWKDMVIYGDGEQTRSFQYIDDLVEGIDRFIRHKGETGPINFGNPNEITVAELVAIVKRLTGTSSRVAHANAVTHDPRRRCPDITKAKQVLGWEPKTPLEEGLKKTIAYFKTIEAPERKVLVFATTYYPDMGPAEKALFELSKEMPDTEFHIVTTRFKKGRPEVEEVGTDMVHRVGIGHAVDKYLLPILGFAKAKELAKKHDYRFVWSVMGSYSGMAALLYKFTSGDSNLLMTLDDKEVGRKGIKALLLSPIYKLILGKTDTIYVSNAAVAEGTELLKSRLVKGQGGDLKAFVNEVRYSYSELLNKQEKKLSRPK